MPTKIFTLLAAAMAVGFTPLLAQAPVFEIATAKPNHSGSQRSQYPRLLHGTLNAENVTLKTLLSAAYGVGLLRIAVPEWLDTERYDIAGKAPEGVPDTEVKPLLQALLRDRFGVEVHREERIMASYDMVPARGGVKIQPFDPLHLPEPPRNTGGSAMVGAGTMAQLADMLAFAAGKPVVDRTGMEGRFSYTLLYAPLSGARGETATDAGPPDFFQAVPDQLGLKLEPKKQPIEVLVVDRAERVPIPN